MKYRCSLSLVVALLISGCKGYQTMPLEVVPPVIHWDASYAERFAAVNSSSHVGAPSSCIRGMIKITFEFPESGEDPDWVKVMLEYPDGAVARMDIIPRGGGMYFAQLPGLAPSGRLVVFIQWLSRDDYISEYRIEIHDGDMRPLPSGLNSVFPPDTLARP